MKYGLVLITIVIIVIFSVLKKLNVTQCNVRYASGIHVLLLMSVIRAVLSRYYAFISLFIEMFLFINKIRLTTLFYFIIIIIMIACIFYSKLQQKLL